MNRDKTLEAHLHGISSNVNICRFLAAVLVILCHAFPIASNSTDFLQRVTRGQSNWGGIAVTIFFFFSGLYVTKSITRHSETWEYLKARCVRIFPPIAVVVLICVFILGPVCTSLSMKEYFGSSATYIYLLNIILLPVHNLPGVFTGAAYQPTVNGALWTMPVEFACYIALLILFKFYTKTGKKKWSLAAILAVLIVGFSGVYFMTIYVLSGAGIIAAAIRPSVAFFVGSAFYIFRDRIIIDWRYGLCGIPILALATQTPLFSVAMVLLLPYVVLCLALGTKQVLQNCRLFELSYEMYLVGWPIQQIISTQLKLGTTPIMNFLITLPIDILIAWIIFQIVEKPLRK